MFFDANLMKDEFIGKVWQAGNYQTKDAEDYTSLPKICENLDTWMDFSKKHARQRFSLRTSAVLVNGAAMLYKKELQQMMDNMAQLDKDMAERNRRKSLDNFIDSSASSVSCDMYDQMMHRAEIHSDSSTRAHTREPLSLQAPSKSNSMSSEKSQKRQSPDNDDPYQSPKRRLTDQSEQIANLENLSYQQTNDDQSRLQSPQVTDERSAEQIPEQQAPSSPTFTESFDFVNRLPNNDIVEASEVNIDDNESIILGTTQKKTAKAKRSLKCSKSNTTKKDQATQHVPLHPNMIDRDGNSNTNLQNLAFGQLQIYKSCDSRIPCKIVYSFLSGDYKNLVVNK